MVNTWHLQQKVERDCVLSNQKHDIWRAARGTADDGGQLWKEPDIAVEATTMDPVASWIPEDLATDLSDGLFDIFEDEAGEKLILVPEDDAGDVQDADNPNRVKFPDCGRGQHNCSSPLCAGFPIYSDYDTGEDYNGQYYDMVRQSILLAAKAQQHWVWLVARLQSAAYRLRPALRKRMAARLKVGDAGAEGNRWQRRSRLQGWEAAWSANHSRWYWWNKITRESRWDPPSTASREARSSSQKEIPVKAHPSSSPTNRPSAGRVPGELTPKGAHASVALWRCAEQRDERTSASITVVPSPVLDPANLWHSLH